jgi:hypothetical protein
MKRFTLILVWTGLFIGLSFLPGSPLRLLWAQSAGLYSLQVASLPTKISAQKEMERLKSHHLQVQAISWEDRENKTWFIISLTGFRNKEEAVKKGNQLIQKKVIRTFRVSLQKISEEAPHKPQQSPPAPSSLSPKAKGSSSGMGPVYVGPIFSEEPQEKKPPEVKESPAPSVSAFRLQVASCLTLEAAQKEIERLKSHRLKANYLLSQTQKNKKVFLIYLDSFKSKEDATQKGNQLLQKKIIKSFSVLSEKKGEEPAPSKIKEASPLPGKPVSKESPVPGKSLVYFGPISVREDEKTIRVNIILDRKIFPEITTDKVEEGSRLIITFKNIDKAIVPIQFEKIQSKTLLSFSLAPKESDCTFILVLSSAYNYEVDQKYYEKEKIYSLLIGKELPASPNPDKKD